MSAARDAALEALLAVLTGAYAWNNIPTRRLLLWGDVPRNNRPAMFLSEAGHEVYSWDISAVPKRSMTVKMFAYFATSDSEPGATQLDVVKDAIDAALSPTFAGSPIGRNTLGGTVQNCRIKGIPLNDPGDIDGDGILVMEIELIFP